MRGTVRSYALNIPSATVPLNRVIEIGLSQPLGRSGQPGLDYDLLELGRGSLAEPDQHRRVAVEVRRSEENLGFGGDHRLLGDQVFHAGAEDRALRSGLTERLQVAFSQRPFPDEQLVLDLPGTLSAHVDFSRLGHGKREA